MGNSHTTFMKMLIKLIAIGLVLAVCSADFDDTPVSEEMISEEAPELTLSQSPREWTPAPKTRPEKESAFDDVLSTTPDLDDPEDILTQNKARAGWWGHRHHPHRHNPHHHVKKIKRSTYSKGKGRKGKGRKKRGRKKRGRKKRGRKSKKFKKKMKRSTYSKGRKKKWNGRNFKKFKKKMKRSTYSKGREKRGRKKRGRKKREVEQSQV